MPLTYRRIKTKLATSLLAILMFSGIAKAQNFSTSFTTSLLSDSLTANNNKDFLYNSLTITNTSSSKMSMVVNITAPAGWQMITDNVVTLSLASNESTIIPMRLLPSGNNTANWEAVKIEYRNAATAETKTGAFAIKVQEFTKFSSRLPHANFVMTGYQKNIALPVYVKNAGNTAAKYVIAYKNEFLHLDGNTSIDLQGGADTTYNINLAISESEFSKLTKEDIKVTVTNNNESITLAQAISKIGFQIKEHSSAYMDMPLQIEGGATYQGPGTNVQYYGGIYGSVNITDKDQVSVAYRSKTYSKEQTEDNGILRADYRGTNFSASLGNILGVNELLMDGYGAKAAYNNNNGTSAEVYGIAKSRNGDTKTIGGNVHFGILKNINLLENAVASFDNVKKVNSAIVKQTAEININERTKLSVIAGVGGDVKTAGENQSLVGTSFGYNFMYAGKNFNVMSNVLQNSNGYTGIYKGQRLQTHEARLVNKNFFIGGFFEYNLKKESYFADSTVVNNAFDLKTTNYGVRAGWSTKVSSLTVAAGNQKQMQATDGPAIQTNFNYVNLNSTVWLAKKLYVSLNSTTGFNEIVGQPGTKTFVSSNQGSIQFMNAGVSFRYDKGPFFYNDFVNYAQQPQNYERFFVSPYAEVSMFKKSLVLRAQYNYAEVVPESPVTSNILFNVSYTNASKGYDFHVNGMLPVKQEGVTPSPYLSASFRVRINAPCVAVKKYHTVKLVMFKDANSNGVRDANEAPIVGQAISLNGNMFVSDENGEIVYKNVEATSFKANLGYASKIKGWSPAAGANQTFEAATDKIQFVPFRPSKVLQGKLTLVVDSNSSARFNLGSIKVTVTSSDNTTYSTLTDEEGNFYFNLPTDNYVVSLSEAAFDEHFRPSQLSQRVDLTNNQTKNVYFEIRQKKRAINIKKQ